MSAQPVIQHNPSPPTAYCLLPSAVLLPRQILLIHLVDAGLRTALVLMPFAPAPGVPAQIVAAVDLYQNLVGGFAQGRIIEQLDQLRQKRPRVGAERDDARG